MADAQTTNPQMLTDWYQSYMKEAPQAESYTATQATTTDWTPDKNSTVQGQLSGIINSGSPLMQLAETRAKQKANEGGLLNSSLAVGAGQAALYDYAMPIAQQDAGTFARAGEFNTAARNTASLTNAGFSNDAARYNTSARNDALAQQRSAGIQGEQTAQQRAEAAAARSFQSSEREASQNFQAAQQKIQNDFNAYQQELERQGMDSRQAQQLAMQESLAKMQEAGVQNRFDAELALKSTQFDAAQAADDRRLAQQHANTLEQMGYANSLNTANVPSTFAASISSTTMNQVNAILADPNLDPTAKKNAVDNVVNYANSTIAWAEKFYNTTLPYILPPTNQSQVAPTQATTTQPQAADQTLNKVPSGRPTGR